MNISAALAKVRGQIESLGYIYDTRREDDTPTKAKSYRLFWETLRPATDTAGQPKGANFSADATIVISLPSSGGNPAQTSLELGEECEAIINQCLALHSENDSKPTVILQFEESAPYLAKGNYIRAAISFTISYLAKV